MGVWPAWMTLIHRVAPPPETVIRPLLCTVPVLACAVMLKLELPNMPQVGTVSHQTLLDANHVVFDHTVTVVLCATAVGLTPAQPVSRQRKAGRPVSIANEEATTTPG